MNARQRPSMIVMGLAQVGACGIFLIRILRALPLSLRYLRETVRQVFFVGAMSLTIIMICGLFVGMVLGLQLYHTLSIFGGTAALGTVVALSLYRELGPVVTALLKSLANVCLAARASRVFSAIMFVAPTVSPVILNTRLTP